MDYSYLHAEDSLAKGRGASDAGAKEENICNLRSSNEDFRQSVSLIPTSQKGDKQITKKKQGANKMAISNFTNSKTAATSSCSNFEKERICQKRKTYKPDYKSLLDQRSEK